MSQLWSLGTWIILILSTVIWTNLTTVTILVLYLTLTVLLWRR